jgi:cytochrome c
MKFLYTAAASALLMLGAPLAAAQPHPAEAALSKAGCVACHAKDRKLVGPSFKEIAAKYKGQADVVPQLMEKSRKGGKGNFGPIPMPPNPPEKISDADLKLVVEWILQQ